MKNLSKKEEIGKFFVNYFGENNISFLDFLERIYREKNIKVTKDELLKIINNISEDLEYDRFERSLSDDSSVFNIDFNKMDGYEFETFLKNLFEIMGYKVEHTKLSGDQGADLIIERFGEKTHSGLYIFVLR